MSTDQAVVILRTGNRIAVAPTTPHIRILLRPQLTYTEKRYLRGREAAIARANGLGRFEERDWECFVEDLRGRIVTSIGFLDRILRVLRRAGYEVVCRWATEEDIVQAKQRRETVYAVDWSRLNGEKLLHRQRECLELIARHETGRVDCPTGWGKSKLIGFAAKIFYRAKIGVVTRAVDVLQQRLYPELCQMVPSVGIVGGGMRRTGRRVMCYTAASLQHADPNLDIVFGDESHEFCSDDCAAKMGRFRHARMWSFSASHDMRLDNKNLRAEAMFGPIRISVAYQEAVDHDMIVPIRVLWTNVISDVNPCVGMHDADKLRAAIWRHDYRNQCIAGDARRYDDDTQVLITVATIEHALALKQVLPEFTLVYREDGIDERSLRYFRNADLLPPDYRPMTLDHKLALRKRFEKGTLKKVIVTTVWNRGVDFRHLQVLIRGDAGGSPINDTQIPGRVSRRDGDDKEVGIVHDYLDQFDKTFAIKAKRRAKSYDKHRWAQRKQRLQSNQRELWEEYHGV